MDELLATYGRLLLLVALLSIGWFLSPGFKSREIDMSKLVHFPQPEPADKNRGHWPWVEKSAAAGDPRRSFRKFLFLSSVLTHHRSE